MARGRMLDQSFVTSSRLRRVCRDDRLLYACILPFVDRKGRHNAEPYVLMATIFRLTDFTIDEVTAGVARLNAAGLLELYSDDDNAAVLEVTRFLEFNKPNHKEAKSRFASPENGAPVRDQMLIDALVNAHSGPSIVPPGGAPGNPPGPPGVPPYNGTERKLRSVTSAELAEPPKPARQRRGAAGAAPAIAAYLDRQHHTETPTAAEALEALKAKWADAS